MDPIAAFAAEIKSQIRAARTGTAKGRVVAVSGGEVSFTIGPNTTPMKGRWVGASSPDVGEVVTYLDDGSGYPIVFGPTGRDALGTLYEWTLYTPVWTADVNPTLGNGGITGRYARASQWVMVEVHIKAGTTTSFGTGAMRVTMPFNSANNGDYHQIEGHVHDQGVGWFPITGLITSGSSTCTIMYHSTTRISGAVSLDYLGGGGLGDADAVHLFGIYRTF